MYTIIAPTDFSPAADNAVFYAAHLAHKLQAKLLLFNAYTIPAVTVDIPIRALGANLLEKPINNDLRKLVQKLHHSVSNTLDITYLINMSPGSDGILAIAENTPDGIIVMGMKHAGPFKELILGSTATAVIQKSNIPVLIIPEKIKYNAPEKMVFAVDTQNDGIYQFIEPLSYLLNFFHAYLVLVHVSQGSAANEYLSMIQKDLIKVYLKDIPHTTYFPEGEDIDTTIINFVKEHHADWLVMVPHKHSFLERLLNKSNTRKITFHTPIPLFILPDKKK